MSNYPFVPGWTPPTVIRGEGAYLVMADGSRILDAAGGAIVTNIGHGRSEVAAAVAEATEHEGYVVPPWLTPSRLRLTERLVADWLPPHLSRIHLTCGGSEGVESAMKIAIQHFAALGRPEKYKIVGRSISYHGTTLGTTALGGHAARKRGLEHVLQSYPSTPTPYPLRCPANDPAGYYLDAFEATVEAEGPDTIAAFVGEPIVGASGGALVPPEGYWPGIRKICDRHDILLIADEVMTGFGRTGRTFGYQHWPCAPDILVAGKGMAGGYAPLTGIFATEAVAAPIAETDIDVMFHTFAAHPAACAAGDKVLDIMARENLVERAATMGEKLMAALTDALGDHPHVAEIRGRGLLQGVELVADRDTLECFPLEDNVTTRLVGACLKRGVFIYGGGTGVVRDVMVIGPPFIIDDNDIDRIVTALAGAIDEVL